MTKKTTLQPLPDLHAKHHKTAGPLNVLCSCRVRLTADQRATLKAAWKSFRDENTPESKPGIGGSGVRTATQYKHPAIAGLSDMVLNDLIVSRDSISLTTILNLEVALGVKVLKREDLEAGFSSYLDYVYAVAKDHGA